MPKFQILITEKHSATKINSSFFFFLAPKPINWFAKSKANLLEQSNLGNCKTTSLRGTIIFRCPWNELFACICVVTDVINFQPICFLNFQACWQASAFATKHRTKITQHKNEQRGCVRIRKRFSS